jgi:hypothetical protein
MFIFGALQCLGFIVFAIPQLELSPAAYLSGCEVPIGEWLLVYGITLLLSGLIKIGLIYRGRKQRQQAYVVMERVLLVCAISSLV